MSAPFPSWREVRWIKNSARVACSVSVPADAVDATVDLVAARLLAAGYRRFQPSGEVPAGVQAFRRETVAVREFACRIGGFFIADDLDTLSGKAACTLETSRAGEARAQIVASVHAGNRAVRDEFGSAVDQAWVELRRCGIDVRGAGWSLAAATAERTFFTSRALKWRDGF